MTTKVLIATEKPEDGKKVVAVVHNIAAQGLDSVAREITPEQPIEVVLHELQGVSVYEEKADEESTQEPHGEPEKADSGAGEQA